MNIYIHFTSLLYLSGHSAALITDGSASSHITDSDRLTAARKTTGATRRDIGRPGMAGGPKFKNAVSTKDRPIGTIPDVARDATMGDDSPKPKPKP